MKGTREDIRKMAALQVTLLICMLYLNPVHAVDWMANYMDGMIEQISRYGLQQFPEKAAGRMSYHRQLACPDTSPSPLTPTTADRVKPADVKIVAALGDSLTTAIGANATNVLQLPTEYRQFSWSIGGYGNISDVITLPNILKIFNPDLVGFAKRSTLTYRPAELEATGLNLAKTGANSYLFPEQTRHLIDTLKTLPGINYEEDWKVITIFIGANDLCDYCKNKTLFSVETFISSVTESLDMMQKELPRSIVNVVQLLQIYKLRQVNDNSLGCILQRSFCACVVKPKENSPELLEVMDQNRQFQEKLEDLIVKSRRYDGKRDFAVVLQPFLQHVEPAIDQSGQIDYSFFTPDCFHLTIKGHEQMAKALWNNMLQPVGKKSLLERFSDDIEPLCPSEDHPYIYTRKPEDTEGRGDTEDERNVDGASSVPVGSRLLTALCLITLIALPGASS
ncbi:phospholipase B1, membrane-associated-like [Rana temporaria]|uniref:phospholipase B1, membrane-associated-like n=1 Tax=Rana temporaria TaxID=8407 RepID=UPI001AAC7F7A|nr:phospholipase B1, membrane-associated-like [Rana temporaria]